ncbi:hypothetical protein BGV71_32135 [Burkholderia ubonensis]|nr:hypothetical protein BGV71_32135 [Burkholderia ubonensis]
MYAHVTPMRRNGKALEQHEIRSFPSVRGDLTVSHQHIAALGRHADVASVQAGGSVVRNLLPPLVDVRLAHMGTTGFVLSGLQIEGSIAFAQSWWCRPDT